MKKRNESDLFNLILCILIWWVAMFLVLTSPVLVTLFGQTIREEFTKNPIILWVFIIYNALVFMIGIIIILLIGYEIGLDVHPKKDEGGKKC